MPKKAKSSSFENIFASEAHRTIYIEISYLKKRIHLVEGERKANFESNEAQLKKNEEKLHELKGYNSRLKKDHKLLINARDNCFKEVSKHLGGEKQAAPFRNKNYLQTIEIFECKMGDLKNKMNLLHYKKNTLNEIMANILNEEKNLRAIIGGKFTRESKGTVELKVTETSIAAMQMKITEAENIRGRYKNMLTILKQENFNRIIKANDLERRIELENKEILRIQQVLQDALKARKCARKRLTEVEIHTIAEYSDREQELFESRMKLKQIRERMDAIGTKLSYPKFHLIHRDSSITEGLYVGTNQTAQLSETKSQTVVEAVYNLLADMTGESDPEQIVIRFEEQRQHAKELKKQEEDSKSEVRKAKLLTRFLNDKLGQLQFSGGLRREKLNERGSQIKLEITNTNTRRAEMEKAIMDYSTTMEQLITKLNEICEYNDISYLRPQAGSPGEKIICILKHIVKNIEQMFENEEGALFPSVSPNAFNDKDYTSENESYMSTLSNSFRFGSSAELNVLDPSVVRRPSVVEGIVADAEKGNLSVRESAHEIEPLAEKLDDGAKMKPPGKKSDSSDEEEATTRNFVKRQSQIIIEAKTRKGRFNPSAGVPNRHRRY